MLQIDMFSEPRDIDPNKIHVVNFSGGRTSAYLVWLMEQKRKQLGIDVRYIYCDTGAESGLTLRFIREVVKFWGIDLTVLQVDINPELGKGNGYTVWSPADIQTRMPRMKPFADMIAKYGTPTVMGPFCSSRLKTEPNDKYCNDVFGKGNYVRWLGMRADEPGRLKRKEGIYYLADISDYTKEDIEDWWSTQPFDLQIEEHLGNCLFCIKKSTAKIALAIKDEAPAYKYWRYQISRHARVVESRTTAPDVMYRGYLSLDGIATMYADTPRDDIYKKMKYAKRFETGSCSESCEAIDFAPDEYELEMQSDGQAA